VLRILGHLIATAFQTLGRIILTAALFAALGAGGVVLVASRYTHVQWPPTQLITIALIGVAALAAYAGGITALMFAAIKGLLGAAKLVEREAAAPFKAIGEELEGSKR
jgi:hypothetical protein